MKLFTRCFTSFIYLVMIGCSHVEGLDSIQWQQNYEKAFEQAKSTSKPLLLFFTGSDWCGWCTRLEEEVLNTPEFAEISDQHFIFVRLDFPLYNPIESQIASQNKELRKKFDVRSFPMIILIDENQSLIGSTGYRAGGGREYGNHLLRMVKDYRAYQQCIAELEKSKLSEQELQKLFEKARQLQRESDAEAILNKGLSQQDSFYFLREKFRSLAEKGYINSTETQAFKQKLLALDTQNIHHINYDIAMIEFEANCSQMENESFTLEAAIAPLVQYIEKFEKQDQDNAWRIQMIISQVYLDNNKLAKALQYAQKSYQTAPQSVQPDISIAIHNIQAQLKSSK